MRKNIILGFLLAFAAANISAQNPNQMPKKAQTINLSERWGNYERSQYFGVRFGMNVSQVMFYGPDVDNSSRVGFNGGLVAGFMLSKSTPIFTETGLLYQGKGAYVNNDRDDRVAIVTNDYHLFRGMAIARKQGIAHVSGIAAGATPWYLPNNMARESFGLAKDFVFGNL